MDGETHWQYKSIYFCAATGKWRLRKKRSLPTRDACWTYRCRGFAIHTFNSKGQMRRTLYCAKCKKRVWRVNTPLLDLYFNLKHRAKQRKVDFNLRYGDFLLFCIEHNYHVDRGRSGDAIQIDRIDPTRGYSIDNIQPLSAFDNNSKHDNCPF